MISHALLQAALWAGVAWSFADQLRLSRLGLLTFSSPGRLALFSLAHAGLCAGAALVVGLVAAAPLALSGGAAWLRLWCAGLAALCMGLGTHLTYRVTPPWVLPSILPLCLVFWLMGAEPLRGLAAAPAAVRRRSALLAALLALAAAVVHGRLKPMQLFPFHFATSLVGMGLALLAALLLLPRPRRLPGPVLAGLLCGAAFAVRGDEEVRHALLLLGQDSRAVLWALGRGGGLPGALGDGPAAPLPPAPPAPAPDGGEVPGPCGPRLVDRVVLVTIDALRADHLRAYGYPRETAPHLSALARRAVLFERAYALFPATAPALRRIFAVRPAGGREVSALTAALDRAAVRRRGVVGEFMMPVLGDGILALFPERDAPAVGGFAVDRALAPRAEAALLAPDDGAPQLLWVHLYSPHGPYTSWPEGPRFGARPVDLYDSEIGEADRALGRILAAAARPPRGPRTAVIVTADHGEEFQEHGSTSHARYGIFEEELRVPLLIALPGAAPRRAPEQVSHEDLAPTLLSLLGACAPALPGRALLPALRGEALPPRAIFTGPQAPYGTGALIEGRWKLAYSLFSRSVALYDLEADPRERLSLLHARPEVAARLRALLLDRLEAARREALQPGDGLPPRGGAE